VTDGGNSTFTNTATVTVNLRDENDNKPIFQMDSCEATLNEDLSDLEVDEDGNHIIGLTIFATDMDISETYSNESIIYQLKPALNNGFNIRTTINEETGNPVGVLYIEKNKNPFDYETDDTYIFEVSAIHYQPFVLLFG
jgi:hypothetical protein